MVTPVNPDLLARAVNCLCPAALASGRLRSQTSLRRVLENRLGPRYIVVEAGKHDEAGNPQSIAPSDSDPRGNLTRESQYKRQSDKRVSQAPDHSGNTRGNVRAQESYLRYGRHYNFYEAQNEETAKTLWARAQEMVCKLAILHGISSNGYNPLITEKSVKWAWKFINHLTRQMLYMADSYVYGNGFDEKCQLHDSLDNLKKVVETFCEGFFDLQERAFESK